MYKCAYCTVRACDREGASDKLPTNCPMKVTRCTEGPLPEYFLPENHDFYVNSSEIEARGYGQWPRLREIVEFCHSMNFDKVGMAFCAGLHDEARLACEVLRKNGIDVVSVRCKAGHIDKSCVGIRTKVGGEESFEAMCNPILQSKLLNEQKTQLNILFGLCVGHDSLVMKYSDAPVTTLVAKDRLLAHNPIGAVYCSTGYMKKRLFPDAETVSE